MSMFGTKLRKLGDDEDLMYAHDCPACRCRHYFPVLVSIDPTAPKWSFNEDAEKPTFEPSMNIRDGECHYWVKEGKIIYTEDCRHDFKGKTVDLPDLKEY